MSLGRLAGEFASLQSQLQGSDAPPTSQVLIATLEAGNSLNELARRLEDVRKVALPAINEKLRKAGVAELTVNDDFPFHDASQKR